MAKILSKNIGDIPGTIKSHGSSSEPNGYLICDGRSLSQTQFKALFDVIGTNFGNGTTGTVFGTPGGLRFNLPDCRCMFIRGASSDAVVVNDPVHGLISYAAIPLGTRRADQFQGHKHELRVATNPAGSSDAVLRAEVTTTPNRTSLEPVTDGVNGLPRYGSETRPANIALNYIIKY